MTIRKKVILLATVTDYTSILYHRLSQEAEVLHVVMENPPSRISILKNRIKKLGIFTVIGQLFFLFGIARFLKMASHKRRSEILKENSLSDDAIPPAKIKYVSSVNSIETIDFLTAQQPDFFVLSGTRILSAELLAKVPAAFINIHAGITPRYRGVHGGYWALAMNDAAHCGVTVHWVDKGIDTGQVLAQEKISPTSRDNFVTYPYLQLAVGIELLIKILKQDTPYDVSGENKQTGGSKLWSHPTLFQYLYYRWRKGIK